jgi:predicted alpha/beta-hydrolase family hydrolase
MSGLIAHHTGLKKVFLVNNYRSHFMKISTHSILISQSIGSVTAESYVPERMLSLYVFAHGAGAGMSHPFMTSLSQELSELGIGTLRFNFPFTEQKKKRPDVPAVAHKTIETVVQKAKELFPSTPIFVGGKSFGGRMTSQYLSKPDAAIVKGVVFVGFPLHPPGKPSVDRAEHLKDVKIPMLFLQGTRDALANWTHIEQTTSSLTVATLVKFEGADHSFKVARQNILPMLAKTINDWMVDTLT